MYLIRSVATLLVLVGLLQQHSVCVGQLLIHRLQHSIATSTNVSISQATTNATVGGGVSSPRNRPPFVSIVTTTPTPTNIVWYKTNVFLGVFAGIGFLVLLGVIGLIITLYRKKRLG